MSDAGGEVCFDGRVCGTAAVREPTDGGGQAVSDEWGEVCFDGRMRGTAAVREPTVGEANGCPTGGAVCFDGRMRGAGRR